MLGNVTTDATALKGQHPYGWRISRFFFKCQHLDFDFFFFFKSKWPPEHFIHPVDLAEHFPQGGLFQTWILEMGHWCWLHRELSASNMNQGKPESWELWRSDHVSGKHPHHLNGNTSGQGRREACGFKSESLKNGWLLVSTVKRQPGEWAEMHISNERIINVHPGLKLNYWLVSILPWSNY